MRTALPLIVSTGLCMIIAVVNSAWAVDQKALPPKVSASGKKFEKMTNEECVGLGGKVNRAFNCDSQTKCVTVDGDGVIRSVCIDNKKN